MTDLLKVADVTAPEGFAIKALAAGVATPEQQMRAFRFILERACRINAPSFVPGEGGDRMTAFVEGRRSVGLALAALVALPDEKLKETQ